MESGILIWHYRIGGIVILDHTGKIDINNTFEERLVEAERE